MATQHRPRFQYEESSGSHASGFAAQCTDTTVGAIRDFPMTSLLVGFGLGLGLGAALGAMLIEQAEPVHQSRFEQIGRRVMETLSEAIPNSVSQRMRA